MLHLTLTGYEAGRALRHSALVCAGCASAEPEWNTEDGDVA